MGCNGNGDEKEASFEVAVSESSCVVRRGQNERAGLFRA